MLKGLRKVRLGQGLALFLLVPMFFSSFFHGFSCFMPFLACVLLAQSCFLNVSLRFAGRNGAKVAVEDMYFGIPEGECFGYLGLNGAGKTTTMTLHTREKGMK